MTCQFIVVDRFTPRSL